MAVRLFVGNLTYDTTEAELRAHFAAVGPLSSLSLPTDRATGKPRGFAFVEFRARADAEAAIRRLNNQPFQGRPLAVNEVRARDDRSPLGPPGSALHVMLFLKNPIRALFIFNGLRSRHCQRALLG